MAELQTGRAADQEKLSKLQGELDALQAEMQSRVSHVSVLNRRCS